MRGYRKGTKTGIRKHVHKAGERFGFLTVLRESPQRKRGCVCWVCRCACGREAVIPGAKLRGGEYKSCGCKNPSHERGPKSPRWSGGKWTSAAGYRYLTKPQHPNANARGYILEHVFVMSEKIGRPLRRGESVHHKNGKKDDNRPENLELWNRQAHPPGRRVSDLVEYAREILQLYAPEKLAVESGEMLD